ncbi:hypothetical protein GW796_10860 [archaeon]|nr:hypothetical protein [archaeon]
MIKQNFANEKINSFILNDKKVKNDKSSFLINGKRNCERRRESRLNSGRREIELIMYI